MRKASFQTNLVRLISMALQPLTRFGKQDLPSDIKFTDSFEREIERRSLYATRLFH
jgi:hypothetical protein